MTFEPGLKAKAEALVKRVAEKEEQKTETPFERRSRLVKEKRKLRRKARGKEGEGGDGQAGGEGGGGGGGGGGGRGGGGRGRRLL